MYMYDKKKEVVRFSKRRILLICSVVGLPFPTPFEEVVCISVVLHLNI